MSSEESTEEDFDGNKRPAIAMKPLPWSSAVNLDVFTKPVIGWSVIEY